MDIAIVISIAATVLTATAVFVNAWQLRVARIAAGGLAWTVDWSQTHTDESFAPYTAKVRLVGPGVANEVKVMVDGADDIGVALATHRRVVATSDQIVVNFSVAKTEAANARLVVLWSTPIARGTCTEAVRFSVEPTPDGPSFEEWRWYRTAGMRAWYRRKRTPASAYVTGAPVKPLGKWKTKRSWFAMPGEGPIPIDDNRYDRTLI